MVVSKKQFLAHEPVHVVSHWAFSTLFLAHVVSPRAFFLLFEGGVVSLDGSKTLLRAHVVSFNGSSSLFQAHVVSSRGVHRINRQKSLRSPLDRGKIRGRTTVDETGRGYWRDSAPRPRGLRQLGTGAMWFGARLGM